MIELSYFWSIALITAITVVIGIAAYLIFAPCQKEKRMNIKSLIKEKRRLEKELQTINNNIAVKIESMEFCPDCHSRLKAVRRPVNYVLNQGQFDSVKAGDYFCPKCTDKNTRSGFRYFWKRDLNIPEE